MSNSLLQYFCCVAKIENLNFSFCLFFSTKKTTVLEMSLHRIDYIFNTKCPPKNLIPLISCVDCIWFRRNHLLRWLVLPVARPISSQTRHRFFLETHRPICACKAQMGFDTHLVSKRRRWALPTICALQAQISLETHLVLKRRRLVLTTKH